MYGKESEDISRHALHAIRLSFEHPKTKENTVLYAPIPEDMRALICRIFSAEQRDEVFAAIGKYQENLYE